MDASEREKLQHEAWARIGRSADGKAARILLVDRLMFVINPNVNDGALRVDQGERNFALKLLKLLDAELSDDPRDEPDARSPGNRKPVAYADGGSRGPGRRVPRIVRR